MAVASILPSGRHDEELTVPRCDLVHVILYCPCYTGSCVIMNVFHQTGNMLLRGERAECIEARSLQIKIDDENATTRLGKFEGNIHECHRSSDATLEGVEGNDVHGQDR